jgi:hypothetical protein
MNIPEKLGAEQGSGPSAIFGLTNGDTTTANSCRAWVEAKRTIGHRGNKKGDLPRRRFFVVLGTARARGSGSNGGHLLVSLLAFWGSRFWAQGLRGLLPKKVRLRNVGSRKRVSPPRHEFSQRRQRALAVPSFPAAPRPRGPLRRGRAPRCAGHDVGGPRELDPRTLSSSNEAFCWQGLPGYKTATMRSAAGYCRAGIATSAVLHILRRCRVVVPCPASISSLSSCAAG